MSTRSVIGVMHGEKVKTIYCHSDGYLEHNGRILQEHYDSARANNLVALGDLSSLGADLGEKHDFDIKAVYGTPEYVAEMEAREKICTFYGRDRGETGTEFQVAHTFEEFLTQCDNSGAEFYYVMKDGVWYCGDTYSSTGISNKLVPLTEALTTTEEA